MCVFFETMGIVLLEATSGVSSLGMFFLQPPKTAGKRPLPRPRDVGPEPPWTGKLRLGSPLTRGGRQPSIPYHSSVWGRKCMLSLLLYGIGNAK